MKEGVGCIAKAIAKNSSLTYLSFIKSCCEGTELLFGRSIMNLKHLKRLNFVSHSLNDAGLTSLAKFIASSIFLDQIYLTGDFKEYEITEYGWNKFAKALASTSQLSSLSLMLNSIGRHGIPIVKALKNHQKSLTYLDLSYNLLEKEVIVAFKNTLKKLKNLTFLNLSNNYLGEEGAFILSIIRGYSSIRYLDLANTGIWRKGEDFKEDLNAVIACKQLEKLILDGVTLTNTGDAIGKGIAQSSSLTRLSLYCCGLVTEDVAAIGEGVKENRSLTCLELDSQEIGKEGVQVISNAIPTLDDDTSRMPPSLVLNKQFY